MASGRLFSRSHLPPLLHNPAISSSQEALDSLFISSPSSPFLGAKTKKNFIEMGRSSERPFPIPFKQEEQGEDELDDYFQQPEKKRRLTPDQVQFLERSFEVENKLEPDRKIQLAKDLALQPRQVAIWFQNRRARWKTKQLEKDFESLQLSYTGLLADYQALLDQKEKLKAEVVVLTERLRATGKGAARVEASDVDAESPETRQVIRVDPGYEEDGSGGAGPLNSFEAEHSDLSQDEDDDAGGFSAPAYGSLRADDDGYNVHPVGSGGFGFPAEDQAMWFWTY